MRSETKTDSRTYQKYMDVSDPMPDSVRVINVDRGLAYST